MGLVSMVVRFEIRPQTDHFCHQDKHGQDFGKFLIRDNINGGLKKNVALKRISRDYRTIIFVILREQHVIRA